MDGSKKNTLVGSVVTYVAAVTNRNYRYLVQRASRQRNSCFLRPVRAFTTTWAGISFCKEDQVDEKYVATKYGCSNCVRSLNLTMHRYNMTWNFTFHFAAIWNKVFFFSQRQTTKVFSSLHFSDSLFSPCPVQTPPKNWLSLSIPTKRGTHQDYLCEVGLF